MSDSGNKAVFLSYASQDAAAARGLCEALRAQGVEVWFDQNELVGGDAWDAKIRKQIAECALFVPVISANTQSRDEGYFRLEWKLAADRTHLMAHDKAFLLPVVIDGTRDADARVPAEFKAVQWTQLRPGCGGDAVTEGLAVFGARVRALLDRGVPVARVGKEEPAPAALPPAPRAGGFWIAVLPFGVVGAHDALADLADGMVEEIVTGLARFSYLRVVARNSSAGVTRGATDVRAAGRMLGARYLLEGSLRQAGTRVRVAVQLVDVESGAHVWAETYDRAFQAEAVFELQDDLVPRIVGMVADSHGRLRRSMTGAVRRMAPESLTPYEVLLRSFGYFEMVTLEEHAEVRALLERVVVETPELADGWAMLAFIYADEFNTGLNPRPDPLGRALAAARRAVAAGPTSELACSALAAVHFARREMAPFRQAAERAVALNPLHGTQLGYMGALLTYAGDATRGLALVQRARQLNPEHPGWFWFADFHDAYRRGDFPAAAAAVINANLPGYFYSPLLLAATWARMGQGAAAAEALRELLTLRPGIAGTARDDLGRWFDAGFVASVVAGLRQAGLAIADDGAAEAGAGADAPSGARAADVRVELQPQKSVAVLPFANLSGDTGQEHVADGLTEEVRNALARERELRVPGRTSSFSFKGRNVPAAEVAKALNVAQLVEGSYRRSGDRVRIQVSLTRAADGFSEELGTFTEEASDLFALQEKVAAAVVAKLTGRAPARIGEAPTRNPAAYDAYMRGRFFYAQTSAEGMERAVDFFSKAVEFDATFAQAWASLARARLWQGSFVATEARFYRSAESAVAEALRWGPELAAAHAARSQLMQRHHFDWQEARAASARAVELAPDDVEVLTDALCTGVIFGEWERGLGAGRRAMKLDPLNPEIRLYLAVSLFYSGALREAEAEIRQALALAPTAIWVRMIGAQILVAQGRAEEALALAQQEPARMHRLEGIALAEFSLGRVTASNAALGALEAEFADQCPFQIAEVYAQRGDADAAFRWLEHAWKVKEAGVSLIRTAYTLRNLHADPRWPALLQTFGLSNDEFPWRR